MLPLNLSPSGILLWRSEFSRHGTLVWQGRLDIFGEAIDEVGVDGFGGSCPLFVPLFSFAFLPFLLHVVRSPLFLFFFSGQEDTQRD